MVICVRVVITNGIKIAKLQCRLTKCPGPLMAKSVYSWPVTATAGIGL